MNEIVEVTEKKNIEDRKIAIITIDNLEHKTRLGKHSVAEIKTLGSVPLAYDLEQIIGGKLTLLPDDGEVQIEGKEVFVSHPKDGDSS